MTALLFAGVFFLIGIAVAGLAGLAAFALEWLARRMVRAITGDHEMIEGDVP